jgi:hypothetical protein
VLSTEGILALLDAAMVASLAIGFLLVRRLKPPVVRDTGDAYLVLNRTIERFVPDLPAGFTWGDAVEHLKGYGMKVDWPKMESSLAEYEAFRYGGRAMPLGGGDEALRLSTQIRRSVVGYRNKGKGTGPD